MVAVDHRLTGRSLGWYPLPLLAVAMLAVATVLAGVTGVLGVPASLVLAALGYLVAQTALSVAVEGRRRAVDRLCTALVYLGFGLAALPLLLIGWYTVSHGLAAVNADFLTRSMFRVNPERPGGGVYHAIVGTLTQSLLATTMAVPIGVLAAIYVVEYGRGRRYARLVSFVVDVLAGVPSVVAGLFIYTAWILVLGFQKSGLAGAFALALVMLPVVIRSTEQMIRLVPADLREAAYALGVAKWRTIMRIVLPTALGGIITGVMLGVARVAGETAPLLLLVGVNQRIEFNPFTGHQQARPQESVPTLIFEQFGIAAGNTSSPPFQRAWGAALVLVIAIGLVNAAARLIAWRYRVTRS
jgi:phosphate transport system permease protein